MSHTSIDTGLSTVLLVSPKVFCCCVTFVLNMEIGSFDATFQQHPSLTYLSIMVNDNVTYLTLKGYTNTLQFRHNTLQFRHTTLQFRHNTLQFRHNTLHFRHNTLHFRHNTLQFRHNTVGKVQQWLLLFYLSRNMYVVKDI